MNFLFSRVIQVFANVDSVAGQIFHREIYFTVSFVIIDNSK